ncbi:hypothetical protein LEMLEM_LOCUS9088 [Lemmus lemmus]
MTLTGWDEEANLCLNLGLGCQPALSWHPPRPKVLQLVLF